MKNIHALVSLMLLSFATAAAGAQPRRPAASKADAIRLNNLGAAYMNRQQFERALKLFRAAAALDPKLEATSVNEGIALLNLQRLTPALRALEAAVKAHAKNAHAWYNLGLLYKSQGNPTRALERFERAAILAPEDPDIFYFIRLMQSQLIRQAEAIAAFRHALELNSFHAAGEFGLDRAFQRSGQGEQAREHLARFQHLTQAKLGAPMGLVYGDQGPLSLAIQTVSALQPPSTSIPVKFSDVTQAAGLQFKPRDARPESNAVRIGSGACFFDLDNDGLADLLIADGGPQGGVALLRNTGKGRFEDVTAKSGLDGKVHATACAAGTYDNDGQTRLELTVDGQVLFFNNQGDGTLKDVTASAGIRPGKSALSLTFVDYDHDGDLDLLVSGMNAGTNVLWRNNGNGTFTDATAETNLAGNSVAYGVIGTDFNSDRAIDLVFAANKPELLLNPPEGKWRAMRLGSKSPPAPVVGAARLDFDKDGWMDVAFSHAAAPGITLWRNLKGHGVEQVKLPIEGWRRAWGLAALDYDNDGWIDLVAVGERQD